MQMTTLRWSLTHIRLGRMNMFFEIVTYLTENSQPYKVQDGLDGVAKNPYNVVWKKCAPKRMFVPINFVTLLCLPNAAESI